jgi:hypothetical protein
MYWLPPLVIDVRVRETGKKGFRIWLPFFLLWPLLLIVVGFALVVSLTVDLALLIAGARYHHYTALLLRSVQLLAETRGTCARIDSRDDSKVDVDIY